MRFKHINVQMFKSSAHLAAYCPDLHSLRLLLVLLTCLLCCTLRADESSELLHESFCSARGDSSTSDRSFACLSANDSAAAATSSPRLMVLQHKQAPWDYHEVKDAVSVICCQAVRQNEVSDSTTMSIAMCGGGIWHPKGNEKDPEPH